MLQSQMRLKRNRSLEGRMMFNHRPHRSSRWGLTTVEQLKGVDMPEEVIWSDCRECKRSTKHTIIGTKEQRSDPDYYNSKTAYLLIQCNGCETISFRKEFHDFEEYYQTGPDEWEHPIDVEIFPHHINDHMHIDSMSDVSDIVTRIYEESLLAIQEGAYTLAGLGLRATIEAICNDKEIKGKNLQVRINAMNRVGLISKSDADRLHAIRFMGNDAAHEIKKAKKKSVFIALKIIEHVILSVYVLESEVNKYLEKPITTIDEALPVLKKNLKDMEDNSTFTLSKWLGNAKRRILENYEEIEAGLIARIQQNEIEGVMLSEPPEAATETDRKSVV